MASVYIVRVGEYLKIGYSGDVKKRMDSFRAACPYEIELVYHKEYRDSGVAFIVESAVHNRLKEIGCHSRNEWFLHSEESIEAAKSVLRYYTNDVANNARSIQLEMKEIIAEIRATKGLSVTQLSDKLKCFGLDSDAVFVNAEFMSKKNRRQVSKKAVEMAWDYLIEKGNQGG